MQNYKHKIYLYIYSDVMEGEQTGKGQLPPTQILTCAQNTKFGIKSPPILRNLGAIVIFELLSTHNLLTEICRCLSDNCKFLSPSGTLSNDATD